MRSVALNVLFIVGYGCCVASAFLVATPLGLLVLGLPMTLVAIHMQGKVVK
jgi:hypothetical protein